MSTDVMCVMINRCSREMSLPLSYNNVFDVYEPFGYKNSEVYGLHKVAVTIYIYIYIFTFLTLYYYRNYSRFLLGHTPISRILEPSYLTFLFFIFLEVSPNEKRLHSTPVPI